MDAGQDFLKEKYPDCLLLGETWGSGRKLMLGNQMDSIMNYIFRDSVRDFFAAESIDAADFDGRLNHMLAEYPGEMQQALYNPLDSHDTERFLYLCGEISAGFGWRRPPVCISRFPGYLLRG